MKYIFLILSLCCMSCTDFIMPNAKQDKALKKTLDSIDVVSKQIIPEPPSPKITVIKNNDIGLGAEVEKPESILLPKGLKSSTKKYDIEIRKAIKRYWLLEEYDFAWLKGLYFQESRLNDSAKSYCGAVGISQIMLSTSLELGAITPDQRYDPIWSINAGARYLEKIRNAYFKGKTNNYTDEIALTSSGYNAGSGYVRSKCKQYGYSMDAIYPNINKETQGYWKHISYWRSLIYYGLL